MSTPTEDSLEPGPDGKLISTEERMQIIQQQQQPETTPEKAAPVEGTTGPPLTVHTISTLFFFSSSLGLGVVVLLGVFPPAFYVVWLTRYSPIVSKYFWSKLSKFFYVIQQKYLLIMGMLMSYVWLKKMHDKFLSLSVVLNLRDTL